MRYELKTKAQKCVAAIGTGLLAITIPSYMIYSSVKENARVRNEVAKIEAGEAPSFYDRIDNADSIRVSEKVLSFGKHYDIYIDGERVAEITGKAVKLWGDEFTFKDLAGNVLAAEKENKRIFRWNREAIINGGYGEVEGYLGEERFNDLFNWGYVMHFYDSQKNEIGKSQKIGRSAINFHALYDNNGNKDYEVDKRFNLIRDVYDINVLDKNSSIPITHALLLVCVEDAIKDSQEAKESDDGDDE